MKKILCTVPILFLVLAHAASQTDSLAFVKAEWEKHKIKPGIWWKYHEFRNTLFSSNQYINIVEVKNKGRRKFDLGFEKKILKRTSDFGKDAHAIAAINGTFFDVKNGGSVNFIKADGEIINENRVSEKGIRGQHQKAAIILKHGKLHIGKWDETTDWEKRLDGDDIMTCGPLLLFRSASEKLDSTVFSKTRHPRSAMAVTKKKVLMIAVDGRDDHAAGMSLFELIKILQWLGVVDGINLDGGGSTTLWINNQPENGVVNYPSDNKIWDHAGERNVANVLLLKNFNP